MPRRLKKYFVAALFLFLAFLIPAIPAAADTLGQQEVFSISDQYDDLSRDRISATLRWISDRAIVYIEDGYWNNLSQNSRSRLDVRVREILTEFDNRIYPIETNFFGSEPNPGLDGDPKITILLSPLLENAGGYFDSGNQNPKTPTNHSNGREMIYLNLLPIFDDSRIKPFLAHEFQHLISFNQKENLREVNDDVWLNELRSEYAVSLLGYNDVFGGSNLQRRLQSLASSSSGSLTEWGNSPFDYAQVALFGEYLADHWSPKVIADTLKTETTSISSVNEALAANGFKENFIDVFRDWAVADYVNDTKFGPRFGYRRSGLVNFKVPASKSFLGFDDSTSQAETISVKDWQAKWFVIGQFRPGSNNTLKIDFSSPSLVSFQIAYVLAKGDTSRQVKTFEPLPGKNSLIIPGIGSDFNEVILIPIKRDKIGGFTAEETTVPLTFTISRTQSVIEMTSSETVQNGIGQILAPELPPPVFRDGSLIRAENDPKVYVVKGDWIRHITSPRIFDFYGHLSFDNVKEVEARDVGRLKQSRLIRLNDDKKIFEIDKNGARHWLEMSGEQFLVSGRSFDAVFEVNQKELNFYKLGASIKGWQ